MQKRVRGVIVEDGALVVIKRIKGKEEYYVFPGGGVEEGEDLQGALTREIKEELGVDVEVGDLMHERVYDKPGLEQREYFFACKKTGGDYGTGTGPEFTGAGYEGTHTVIRISLAEISKALLYPEELKSVVLGRYAQPG